MVGNAFNLRTFFIDDLVKEVMLVFNRDSDDDFVDTLMKNVKETLEYVNTDKQ